MDTKYLGKYVVVERAGYVGEATVQFVDTSEDAWRYIERMYTDDDTDTMHIAVGLVVRDSDGQPFITYEYA